MEPSPLTLQARPDVFQQKVVSLYQQLFKDEDEVETTEGFWKELFLLKPDKPALLQLIDSLSPEDLLQFQTQTQELFTRGIGHIQLGIAPGDSNALDTCTAFLAAVLSKKYTNPSSDIINILAGFDQVDASLSDFVAALDQTIKMGRSLDLRLKAIEAALSVVSGAYQTSLLSYFTHRDLFPSLMKFVQESQTLSHPVGSFILLGLLANYNKFEIQNPYQLRLDDFVNEVTIQKLIRSVGYTCASLRDDYVAVQHDLPEGWSISNTLSMIGLGVLAPVKQATPAYDPEITKEMFAKLPGSEAAILLATYDFVYANKLFCLNFVSLGAENGQENPISSFLSLASYLLQHAHTSIRTAQYSHLSLLIISLLVEDKALCERLCGEDTKTAVRLCRQRSPYLPHVPGERIIATSILDTMIDGINHNLRRRLDVDLYILCLGVISRIISQLSRSRSRLKYHWSELFRSLLSLVRFLTTYTADLKSSNYIEKLLDDLVNLLALSLSAGESFLPNPASYDDLFYKIVEMGEVLVKFRDNYELEKRPTNSIDTLINVSTHYNQLLQDGASGRRGSQLTSAQVAGVIKQGYETLSIQAKEGLDSWTKYREAEKKAFMKKIARCVVTDIKIYIRVELIK
ncbi:BgTH12-06649 [Blumeria graminis f. sp. triticale]|uniref:BgTH12-06649 n=1 Tax=Blumeria graminis f. sp. triticale TaxID=1689686 RepID=A0A9W4GDP1_BLUGR|nr:BgTH12-06649 [Blumeria graminis f. sp. triticale]